MLGAGIRSIRMIFGVAPTCRGQPESAPCALQASACCDAACSSRCCACECLALVQGRWRPRPASQFVLSLPRLAARATTLICTTAPRAHSLACTACHQCKHYEVVHVMSWAAVGQCRVACGRLQAGRSQLKCRTLAEQRSAACISVGAAPPVLTCSRTGCTAACRRGCTRGAVSCAA